MSRQIDLRIEPLLIIGIIGGVASGKSFVADEFERLGAKRIDGDRLGHQVLRESAIKSALRARWGNPVFDEQGEIDRSAVAQIVFAETENGRRELAFLESVTHPRIDERMQNQLSLWCDEAVPVVVIDAALLLKAKWDRHCDRLVYVDVERSEREERARGRGWSSSELARREELQDPLAAKRDAADWIIDNNGSREETASRVHELWQELGLPLSSP